MWKKISLMSKTEWSWNSLHFTLTRSGFFSNKASCKPAVCLPGVEPCFSFLGLKIAHKDAAEVFKIRKLPEELGSTMQY